MAVVRGIREKVHLPLYDSKTFLKKDPTDGGLAGQISGNIIKFFVDVQNKTKLETNQQESSVLSHYNTYEARALRVVVQSDPPAPQEKDPAREDVQRDLLERFIYNSVTTFFVGEKVMIQAPTFMFPSGAGPSSFGGGVTNGSPTPEATFRFAEPVSISHQQSFRVEIEFPKGAAEALKDATGKSFDVDARVWVVIDGYIMRDVQ